MRTNNPNGARSSNINLQGCEPASSDIREKIEHISDELTHWGRATHICIGNLTIIGSDNGLSPYRRQAIIWTNAGILLIGPLGTNFSEISIEILIFSFKKMRLKVSSAKWRPFCLSLNELKAKGCTECSIRYFWWFVLLWSYHQLSLHDQPWILPCIKSIFDKLGITFHIPA